MNTDELLSAMEARAKRQLDGMIVNRDAMARDVLTLVATVRKARDRMRTDVGLGAKR